MNAQWDEQVVEFIHDEFLHALDRILEFCIGGISPNVGLSHLCGDELGKRTVSRVKQYHADVRTFKKSLMTLTWSLTVNVRFAKLPRKLEGNVVSGTRDGGG